MEVKVTTRKTLRAMKVRGWGEGKLMLSLRNVVFVVDSIMGHVLRKHVFILGVGNTGILLEIVRTKRMMLLRLKKKSKHKNVMLESLP